MNLSKDVREKTKVKVNGSLREQGLIMKMGKKIWQCKRYLMQLDRDMGHKNNNIEVRALVSWSDGHVVKNTLGEIFHKMRVLGLRYTVHRRCRLLGMLVRLFHVPMQQWTIGG